MTVGLPPAVTRRRLLGSLALLGAVPRGAGEVTGRDQPLIAAATVSCDAKRRMLALIDGPGRIADDRARDLLLVLLRDAQAPHLDQLCRKQAWSLAGHRARAMAFALWDDGELSRRAATQGFLANRLLTAMIHDLAGMPC